jgi:glycosyltransferase involved in cell wall biosynthesis
MLKSTPITLLMPIRNGEKFLSRAISTLNANCQIEDEILVVNDNSSDSSRILLNDWARRNSNVRVVDNPGEGLVSALNFGLSIARFDWIARFDVDDKYSTNRILETKKVISNDVACIFSDYVFTTSKGSYIGYMPSAVEEQKSYLSLVTSQRTAHPSVCFNKSMALEVGGYYLEDFPAEDISLWLRMAQVGKVKSIPESFLKYRISKNSVSGSLRNRSLEKKRLLISNYNFKKEVIDNCINDLENSAFYYNNFNQGQRRYLLHLRDLILVIQNMPNPNSNSLRYVQRKIYREINNYPAAISLYGQMLVRKMYRLL